MQSLGLQPTYWAKSAEGSFLRAFFGLPFLRPEVVEDCLIEDFGPIAPDNEDIASFMDYVLETYVSFGALFPPTMWAGYAANVIRTTNACEGFHAKLNRMFYHKRPHIFLVLDASLEVQEFSTVKMRSPPTSQMTDNDLFVHEQMLKFEAATTLILYTEIVSFYLIIIPPRFGSQK
jgi:hypothetical protein